MIISNSRNFRKHSMIPSNSNGKKHKFFQKKQFSNGRLNFLIIILSVSLNVIFVFFKPKNINGRNILNFIGEIREKLPLLYFIISWLSLFFVFSFLNLDLILLELSLLFLYFNYLKNLYLKNQINSETRKILIQLLELHFFWLITDILLLILFYFLIQKQALIYMLFFKFFRKTTYLICVGQLDEASLPYNVALLVFILNYMKKFDGNFIRLDKKYVKIFNEGNYFFFRNLFYQYSIKEKLVGSAFFFLLGQLLLILLFN